MIRKLGLMMILAATLALAGCTTGGTKAALIRYELKETLVRQIDEYQRAEAQERAGAMVDASESLGQVSDNFKRLLGEGLQPAESQVAFEEYEAARSDIARARDREWMVKTDRISILETIKLGVNAQYGTVKDIEAANARIKAAAMREATLTAATGIQLIQERQAAKEAERAAKVAREAAIEAARHESHTPPIGE